jgi:hypothetical protein
MQFTVYKRLKMVVIDRNVSRNKQHLKVLIDFIVIRARQLFIGSAELL